ncbi:ESPR-type extended signal peptide-containing protein, partial [Vreelandella aquamarina]
MNNIFRLVWNRTLGCLVVASEAAKSRHKSSINGQPVVQEPAKQSHLFVLKPLLLSTAVMLGSVFFVLNPVHAYTAAGADACADPSNFKIGIGSGARACSEAAIAIGGNAGAAPGVSTENTVAIGRNSAAINVINGGGNNQAGVAIGFNAITYGGVAIGDLAQGSLNSPSVAIGSGSEALGNFSIAIGTHEHQRTQANFNQSTAVGSNAIAGAIGASSFGRQASATGTSATALGRNSIAAGDSSLAVGEQSSASVQFANAIGIQSQASGVGATALGPAAQATVESSLAIGRRAEAAGVQSTSIGLDASATDTDAIAMGTNAEASAANAIAIGKDSVASGVDTGAIGRGAVATGSWAVGTGAAASNGGQAFGEFSTASGNNSSAYGQTATATGNLSSALGTQATAQGDSSTAVGFEAEAVGDKSYAGGYQSKALAAGSSAIGTGVEASAEGAVVIGRDSTASGFQSFAVGHNTNASGQDAVSVGTASKAEGLSSIAISRGAFALDDYATALGGESNANAIYSTAIGSFSTAGAESSTAIGDASNATLEDSVALGSDSVADTAAGINGYIPFGATAADTTAINNTIATRAAVDVGSRQITSVAAGTDDDDAVNVSQLIAAQSDVAAGTNIADVTASENPDGGTIYTVNADGASVSAGDGVDVTPAGPDANNVTDYEVALNQTTKDSLDLADNALQEVVTQVDGTDVKTLTKGDNNANFISGKNIALSDDGAGGIEVATLDNVTFTDVQTDTLTAGPVNIDAAGIDAGSTTISSVAPGIAGTDAVNVNQLDDAAAASKTEVTGGTNIAGVTKATGANGQDIYTVNADGASVSAGDGVDVTPAGPDANNVTDYEVALNQATKDSLVLADSALQTVVTQIDGVDIKTIDENDNVANFVTGDNVVLSDETGSIRIATADNVTFTDVQTDTLTAGPVNIDAAGIDAGSTTISSVAPGIAGTDAVNVNQLDAAAAASKTEVTGGTNIAGVTKATGANGQDIYTVDANGASVSAGDGVDVTPAGPDANNITDYEVALNQATKDSLVLADSALQTVVTQIDGVDVKTIDENDNVANFVTGQNITLSDDGAGSIEIATVDSPQFGNVTINTSGGDTINNLSNTTFDPDNFTSGQAASEDQLKQVSDVANAGWNVQTNGDTATNVAPGDTVQFLDGDNIDITRNGMDITVATAPDLTADSVTINGGPVINNTGIDMGGDTITNVGAPVNNTDAANKQYVDENRVRYYSVNDVPTNQANFNNDGATGANALAAGVAASATEENATAVGTSAAATGAGSTAIGYASKAQGANSFALGENATSSAENSLSMGADSTANTRYSTAIGRATNAQGQGSIALGGGTAADAANASGTGAIAIGGYGAVGVGGANANQNYAVALGSGAQAAASEGDVALGSGSQTAPASQVSQATIGSTTYSGFAGSTPTSVVSVGSAGAERQITNVAAGRITNTSTDAINGSQLFSVVDTGFKLSADNGLEDTVKLGETVNYTNDDGNLVATVRNNEVVYDLADTIDAETINIINGPTLNDNGISMGGNTITNLGDGIADGDAVNVSQLKAAETEVAAGTNVASVVETTGADGQGIYIVNADGATVSAGSTAVAVTPTGPDANNVTDYAVDLSQDSKNSLTLADTSLQEIVTQIDGVGVKTLTKGDNTANFVTGQNIALSDDGAGGIEIATVDSPQFGNVTINQGGGDTINNLSNTTFDPDNFTSGQAASEDQLKQVSDVANAGWNLTANGEAT